MDGVRSDVVNVDTGGVVLDGVNIDGVVRSDGVNVDTGGVLLPTDPSNPGR